MQKLKSQFPYLKEEREEIKMNILHIAKIEKSKYKGVCVAVPSHVISQQKCENVAFMNINDEKIPDIKNQILYTKPFRIDNVIEAWCKPDLVVFHEIYRIEFIQIKNELKKAGIPYIIVPHGSLTENAQKKSKIKKKIANFLFFLKYIEEALAIQFLSETEKICSIGSKKGIIATNGIDIPKMSKESFNEDKTKLLFIGRIDIFYKGIDLMLEAVSLIKDLMIKNSVTLTLFGPDDENSHKAVCELIKKHALAEIVTLHDGIFEKEKEEELLKADIFIQTSRSEGMPTGILEALSYGLPCIVTKGTTLGDKINEYDAGWVADTDVKSIAECIKKAVTEKDKTENKSKNAIKLATEEFSWETITQDTIKQYENIITNR